MFKKPLINNRIRANQVRVIDETGKQVGILPLAEAIDLAQKKELDLIQVSEKADPPVCKIMDYGKYLYQEEKKSRHVKAKRGGEMKGIRLSFGISAHDLEVRAKAAEKFLKEDHKVKIEMRLRGREKALPGFAKEKINNFLEILKNRLPIKIEGELKKEPRGFMMIISADKKQ